MKKVFIALTIAAACYACGGGESKETTPVSNNEANGNSSIGAADSGAAATTTTPATTTPAEGAGTTTAAAGKDGKALIEGSDCRTCHKDDTKLIGPSYVDVAKKYENNAQNVKLLAEKVMKGGSGVWGEIPMAGHPNLKAEDAEAMVTYILSMKK